jgi:hypothetical protein
MTELTEFFGGEILTGKHENRRKAGDKFDGRNMKEVRRLWRN